MNTVGKIITGALLATNLNISDTGNIVKDEYVASLENAINVNFQNNIKHCVDFNSDLIALIISDKIASEISGYEHSIIMNMDGLSKGYIKYVSDRVNSALPSIKRSCQKRELEKYGIDFDILTKESN